MDLGLFFANENLNWDQVNQVNMEARRHGGKILSIKTKEETEE